MADDSRHSAGTGPGNASNGAGRVRETGIALVHEGEYVVPAAGSEAAIEPLAACEGAVVHYHFPVQVELVGGLSDLEREALEEQIWEHLLDALERFE